jgi:hypothetical protein
MIENGSKLVVCMGDSITRAQISVDYILPSTASMQYFLLRRDFDTISARRGLQLTTDTFNLNRRGASMIADLIEEFVIGELPNMEREDSMIMALSDRQ